MVGSGSFLVESRSRCIQSHDVCRLPSDRLPPVGCPVSLCLPALVRTVPRKCQSAHPCSVPGLGGTPWTLLHCSTGCGSATRLCVASWSLYHIGKMLVLGGDAIFYHGFCVSVEVIMVLSFVVLIWRVTLFYLCTLNRPCISGMTASPNPPPMVDDLFDVLLDSIWYYFVRKF